MRTPDRIGPILAALEDLWRERPDLRLDQLVSNIATVRPEGDESRLPDLFYLEDDRFLESLELFAARYQHVGAERE